MSLVRSEPGQPLEIFMKKPDLSNYDKLSEYSKRAVARLDSFGIPHDITESHLIKWLKGHGWERAMEAIRTAVTSEDTFCVMFIESLLERLQVASQKSTKDTQKGSLPVEMPIPVIHHSQKENKEWWLSLPHAERERHANIFAWKHMMFKHLMDSKEVKPLEDDFIINTWFNPMMEALGRK